MNYFERMLMIGKTHEYEAQKRICANNNVTVIEEQDETNFRDMHYDFKTSDGVTFEVKADMASSTTGNVFIEFIQYGKPSALFITTADKHIFYIDDEYRMIDTKDLKTLVKGCRICFVKRTNSKGFVIPISIFKKNSTTI